MLIGDMDSVSPQVLARYESRLSADRLNSHQRTIQTANMR